MTSPIDRLDAAQQTITKLHSDLNSSNRLTRIVGSVMLLLLAGYFAYGYSEIKKLLEPDTLVPYGAQMLQDRIPEARHAIVKQVSNSAPAWAEQVSGKLRDELPGLRGKLEEYVLHETEGMLKQAATLSEDHVRKAIRENKDILDTHIRELADHEELSDASAQALVTALEGELKVDLMDQSELILDTVRSLDTRVRELAKGEGLDEEEQIERQILMLARRIQLSEADPKPIAAPEVKPFVKAENAPLEGEKTAGACSVTEVAKPTEAPAAESKPAEAAPAEAPAAEAKPAKVAPEESKPAEAAPAEAATPSAPATTNETAPPATPEAGSGTTPNP